MLRLGLTFGALVALVYLSACLFLLFQQTRFIFFPSQYVETTPASFNLGYEEVWLSVGSGIERMHGWWIPASEPEAGVVLYLHGNGINIGANVAHARRFQQLGLSVLLMDYRGYGRSEGGFPTEAQVYQDAAATWDYLMKERQIKPRQVFLYGHSLGGAIAIDLALKHPDAAGLIVESSFSSVRRMVEYQGQFWMFPVDLLLTQRFDSIRKVRSLSIPVLFIHGTADTMVPAQMSQQMYAAAPEPKQLVLVPGAGHNNVAEVAGSQYLQAVQAFVQQARARHQLAGQ